MDIAPWKEWVVWARKEFACDVNLHFITFIYLIEFFILKKGVITMIRIKRNEKHSKVGEEEREREMCA